MSRLGNATTLLSAVALIACGVDSVREPVALDLDPLFTSTTAGPSASGHGNVTQAPGVLRTFSFTARQMPDGSVEGMYNNHNRLQGFVNLGDVNCMRFLTPNSAVISGPIRKHTVPELEGQTSVFRVEDNGEGANAPPDRVSTVVILEAGSPLDCRTFMNPDATMRFVEDGNIQVKP